ncbi:MAG: hypothetical protein WC125_04145, partial [Bacteroidales bacterium]
KRISSLFFLSALLFLMSFSNQVVAQKNIIKSFKVENATLEECLKQIDKLTGMGYLTTGQE